MQPLVAKNIKSVIILNKFLILSHHSFKKIEEIELVVYERPSQCCWRTLHSLVIWNNFTLHFSAWQLHNNPERCWLKIFIQLILVFFFNIFNYHFQQPREMLAQNFKTKFQNFKNDFQNFNNNFQLGNLTITQQVDG